MATKKHRIKTAAASELSRRERAKTERGAQSEKAKGQRCSNEKEKDQRASKEH